MQRVTLISKVNTPVSEKLRSFFKKMRVEIPGCCQSDEMWTAFPSVTMPERIQGISRIDIFTPIDNQAVNCSASCGLDSPQKSLAPRGCGGHTK